MENGSVLTQNCRFLHLQYGAFFFPVTPGLSVTDIPVAAQIDSDPVDLPPFGHSWHHRSDTCCQAISILYLVSTSTVQGCRCAMPVIMSTKEACAIDWTWRLNFSLILPPTVAFYAHAHSQSVMCLNPYRASLLDIRISGVSFPKERDAWYCLSKLP